jgi:hypothetical protein
MVLKRKILTVASVVIVLSLISGGAYALTRQYVVDHVSGTHFTVFSKTEVIYLTATMSVSSQTFYEGDEIQIKVTLDKPVSNITLGLRWVDAGQPCFDDADVNASKAMGTYLDSLPESTFIATTDDNGIAFFDLGSGVPVNAGNFKEWHFDVMPYTK